jgi:hypothetical protein
MSYIADGIVCDAPAGRLEGAGAYRNFMAPFVPMVTGSTLIAAFGDDTTAVVVYATQTVPVKSAPGAECVTVTDGKITYSRFIFDRLPSRPPGRPRPERGACSGRWHQPAGLRHLLPSLRPVTSGA